jgi:hypothetical protein
MEEREMSSGLFLIELNRLRRRGDRWRPDQWVFIPLGAQRLVMGGTAALTKTARIGNKKYGCFGWGARMFWSGYEHLVHNLTEVIESPLIVRFSYTQIQGINEFKPPLSREPSPFAVGGSSITESSSFHHSLLIISINLIRPLIRWSSTPKPT